MHKKIFSRMTFVVQIPVTHAPYRTFYYTQFGKDFLSE